MEPLGAEHDRLVRFLFQRGLAAIYLIAFLVATHQFRPLAGEDGLLPIDEYVERRETGKWWHRERVGTHVPAVSAEELKTQSTGPRARVL